jgi:hypothetical protein
MNTTATMKFFKRAAGLTVLSAALMLTSGCDSPGGSAAVGAIFGAAAGAIVGHYTGDPAAGAAIGAALGAVTGGIIGKINADQKAKLQQDSPDTWSKIEHNEEVAKKPASPASDQSFQPVTASGQLDTSTAQTPAQPADAPDPISASDIKAMVKSGIKSEVVIEEITESKSVYSQQDIASLQNTDVPIDPTILACVKSHSS